MRRIDLAMFTCIVLLASSAGAMADDSGEAPDDQQDAQHLYAARQDGKWGFIDRAGNFVIKPTYTARPGAFSEGRASIIVDGKIGFIDAAGRVVIQPKLDWVQPFSDGFAAAKKGIYSGLIDKQGKWHLRGRYGTFNSPINGAAVVKFATGRRYQLINIKGKELLPSHFQDVKWTGAWPAVVLHDGEWYFVGEDGSRGLGGTFKMMVPSDSGLTLASRDRRTWKILNAKLEVVADSLEFKSARQFSEGVAAVFQDYRWHFINPRGERVFEPGFRRLLDPGFVEDRAGVYDDQGKLGFIDKTGKWVIEPQFEEGEVFHNGLARVAKDGKWMYIDKTGKVVWEPIFPEE
jgi:hypothetical protein